MKKIMIFLMILSFVFIGTLSAQGNLGFGIKGGLNMAKLTVEDTDIDMDPGFKLGPTFGGFVTYNLNDKLTIQPEFLWYVLRSPTVIAQCNALTVGAHYPVLKIAQLSEMTIPVPPICEQRVIVNYLNEFTKKIHYLRQLQQKRDLEFDTITCSVLNRAFKGEL